MTTEQQIFELAFNFSRDFESGVGEKAGIANAIDYLVEEVRETERALARDAFKDDVLELVDGFADVAFVAINGIYKTLRQRGQSDEQARANAIAVLHNVCIANDKKRAADGSVARNEVGKVIKPAGWTAPDHSEQVAA